MSREEIPSWATEIAKVILEAVKAKDPYTFAHCCRVGRAARRLGKAMSLSDFELSVLEYAGLFHDIGKVGIPDGILLKPDKLTVPEIDVMKSHPLKSAAIIEPLAHIPFFRFLLPGIRSHHEKIDGSGYPHGIQGEKIPLTARVIAIVDTVDAMTNARPYRQAMGMDKVKKELVDFSGTQFDANMVKVYLEAFKHWASPDQAEVDEQVVAQILKVA